MMGHPGFIKPKAAAGKWRAMVTTPMTVKNERDGSTVGRITISVICVDGARVHLGVRRRNAETKGCCRAEKSERREEGMYNSGCIRRTHGVRRGTEYRDVRIDAVSAARIDFCSESSHLCIFILL